jgi:hypothetical protein
VTWNPPRQQSVTSAEQSLSCATSNLTSHISSSAAQDAMTFPPDLLKPFEAQYLEGCSKIVPVRQQEKGGKPASELFVSITIGSRQVMSTSS